MLASALRNLAGTGPGVEVTIRGLAETGTARGLGHPDPDKHPWALIAHCKNLARLPIRIVELELDQWAL